MEEVTIYTDGACSGNPGPGGWGTIHIMEITAVIERFKTFKISLQS